MAEFVLNIGVLLGSLIGIKRTRNREHEVGKEGEDELGGDEEGKI